MNPDGLAQEAEQYIRPSALYQLAACPGSALMQAAHNARFGQPMDSAEAALGTDGHDRVAASIQEWKAGAAWGDVIASACNQATDDGVDSWTVFCIKYCLEFARDLIEKHGIDAENVLTEQQLDMQFLGFQQKEDSGRADVVLVVPFKLVIVVDWKLGFIDQGDADEHDQTQAYACAAAEQYHCDTVLVYLAQPRAEQAYRVTGAEFDAAALRANAGWTQAVINLARGEDPELCAGYEQCHYCDALATCPEAREYIMRAKQALELLGEPDDAEEIDRLADAAKLAEKFANDGKALAKHALEQGTVLERWQLGTPRANRFCSNVPGALGKLLEADKLFEASQAITIKVGSLPPDCHDLIKDTIGSKLSAPPLTMRKRGKVA